MSMAICVLPSGGLSSSSTLNSSPKIRFYNSRGNHRSRSAIWRGNVAEAGRSKRFSVSAAVADSFRGVEVGESFAEGYDSWYPKKDPAEARRAGVLLHPTSLPGPYGIGDLGNEAIRFLDWLQSAGFTVWQVLPLVPPGRKSNEDGSPYAGQDANCGNTLLISLEELVKDGLLSKNELPEPMDPEYVSFAKVAEVKDPLIAKAAERLLSSEGQLKAQFEEFRRDREISGWLEDAAFFAAIDNSLNEFSWTDWPEPLKNRHLAALEGVYQTHKDFIDIFIAQQFLFQKQWQRIRGHAKEKGIKIMGDMPIYVGHHSADVWANKKSFLLDRSGFPTLVSGVPPDAFSETGQLWGSPLYDWKAMEKDGFSWWVRRIKRALNLYDEFRIDHFRGFAGFWAIPSEAKVAVDGAWKAGPGVALFEAIFSQVGRLSLIAEDLGVITEDVVQLRRTIGAPGMAVLQFAFGGGAGNPHLPHNHEPNQVVYTGTHDNDTALGWWESLSDQGEKALVRKYLKVSEEGDIPWALIESAVGSVARIAIIPFQDILRLGSSARMNIPATQLGNWRWRVPSAAKFESLEAEAHQLRELLSFYNRLS